MASSFAHLMDTKMWLLITVEQSSELHATTKKMEKTSVKCKFNLSRLGLTTGKLEATATLNYMPCFLPLRRSDEVFGTALEAQAAAVLLRKSLPTESVSSKQQAHPDAAGQPVAGIPAATSTQRRPLETLQPCLTPRAGLQQRTHHGPHVPKPLYSPAGMC